MFTKRPHFLSATSMYRLLLAALVLATLAVTSSASASSSASSSSASSSSATASATAPATCDGCLQQASECFEECTGKECGNACAVQWRVCSRFRCPDDQPANDDDDTSRGPAWPQWGGGPQHTGTLAPLALDTSDPALSGVVLANRSDAQMWGSGTFSHDGSTLYFGSIDRGLHAVDARTLEPLWTLDTNGFVGSTALGKDGTLYSASQDGTLYAVSPNGRVLWKFLSPNAQPMADPVVDANGNVAAGDWAGTLFSWTAQGELRWSLDLVTAGPSQMWSQILNAPVVTASGRLVLRMGDFVYAVDDDGRLAWTSPVRYTGQGVTLAQRAVAGQQQQEEEEEVDGGGEEVLCCTSFAGVHLINATDGSLVWVRNLMLPGTSSQSSPSGECTFSPDLSVIYVSSQAHPFMFALSAADGAQLWAREVPAMENRQPKLCTAAVSAAGHVYAGSNEGTFYSFDGKSGAVRWARFLGGWVTAAPSISPNGVVVAASRDGDFVAIGQ
eukprot:TRINITY_DN787_c0_g1_i1.p1 TRINITY_DN787_c0_g1~~TRINITY_DN787_c0_g1_i1.p1  ORF type:complete len:500 (-),score=146.90 TRINITY_DN787_c0_g1_i1:320-1819(-)